ncbi:hypothetical protein RFI_38193, partial [Reticulomyxa filosa]
MILFKKKIEYHLGYDEKEAMEHVIKIATEQTEKILQLYVYAPNENQIVVNFKDYSNGLLVPKKNKVNFYFGYYQLKNVGDDIFYGDFEIAVRAAEDIRTEISEALSEQNNLLQTFINQSQIDILSVNVVFYKTTIITTKVLKRLLIIDWKRSCLNTFDDSNKLKNELPPWDFFVI